METSENNFKSLTKTGKNLEFGWKHLLVRFFAILVISATFSYLQLFGIMSLKSLESKLLIPAISGLIIAIINWKYLTRIALFLMPIWLATSSALAFFGVILINILEMPYDQSTYWWLDLIIEYLPPIISGHWLYSGYSRMARGVSILSWFTVVLSTLLTVFLLYNADVSFVILQAFYYPILSVALSLLHLKKEKSKSIIF